MEEEQRQHFSFEETWLTPSNFFLVYQNRKFPTLQMSTSSTCIHVPAIHYSRDKE